VFNSFVGVDAQLADSMGPYSLPLSLKVNKLTTASAKTTTADADAYANINSNSKNKLQERKRWSKKGHTIKEGKGYGLGVDFPMSG